MSAAGGLSFARQDAPRWARGPRRFVPSGGGATYSNDRAGGSCGVRRIVTYSRVSHLSVGGNPLAVECTSTRIGLGVIPPIAQAGPGLFPGTRTEGGSL